MATSELYARYKRGDALTASELYELYNWLDSMWDDAVTHGNMEGRYEYSRAATRVFSMLAAEQEGAQDGNG